MTSEQWLEFVEVVSDLWEDNVVTRELCAVVKDRPIAIAIYGQFGAQSIVWINSSDRRALGETHLEALRTPEGMERLKQLLMSTHGW
ncbi:MAG: hypothetical protein KIS62_15985 [Ramlibacter sp.]|nr:hypothetical protein [Ramlibacter sp.]MCW5651249.1 hypothetical protein [Ramlibacter sp.]